MNFEKNIFILIIFAIASPQPTTTIPPQTTTAPQTNTSCRFEYPGKGIIDLTTLGRGDGIAAFPDKIPPSGSNYSMLSLFFCLDISYTVFINYRI
jgi:hypothetical protein